MKVFQYQWEWQLKSTPEQLWPFVSDTNRFNRDTGVPAVSRVSGSNPEGPVRHLQFTRFGVTVVYDEAPFLWEYPTHFSVERNYKTGPVKKMTVSLQMEANNAGTLLKYHVSAESANLLGLLAIPMQIGIISKPNFEKVFKLYDSLIQTKQDPIRYEKRSGLPPGGRERLNAAKSRLLKETDEPEIVNLLVHYIEFADDFSLERMQPYALAHRWGTNKKETLKTFLYATRAGMLSLHWDLLCPLCRGAKETKSSLNEINPHVHCDSCNIDFRINFDQLVEITFKPAPAIRTIDVDDYCIGGPQVTPHIVSQVIINSGKRTVITPILEPGKYRVRSHLFASGQMLVVSPDGGNTGIAELRENGWDNVVSHVTTAPQLTFINNSPHSQLFIFERIAWSDFAVTATEVTALQVFRDLFSKEALRPGEQISVGSITIMFTDLKNSTQLYREIGDATAFGYVMNHFDVLKKAVNDNEGALVKTIGDSVMAVFRKPVDALKTIKQARENLYSLQHELSVFKLKAGIHYGPCIAVNLNSSLDYFGSSVNIAARLEGLSSGEDMVISQTVYQDPETHEFLFSEFNGCTVGQFETTLKGFEQEQFDLWRVRFTETENKSFRLTSFLKD